MGHCPQSNHHRSYRHSGSFRSGRLQIAMRTITLLIVHCSATPQGVRLSFDDCWRDHIRHRGFNDIGYHFYVTRDGEIHRGRPYERIGAHCRNHNRHSLGICYEGGLDVQGCPADTRTPEQCSALRLLVHQLLKRFRNNIRICGHRDLSPDRNGDGVVEPEEWVKECPCFEVSKDL